MQTQPGRRERIVTVLRLATGDQVLSWPVAIACTILSIALHFAPNGITVQGGLAARFVVSALGYLPALGFIALARLGIRRLAAEWLRISLTLLSYIVGAALRGFTFAVVFFELGLADNLNLAYRVPSSAMPFGFATAVATFTVGAIRLARERIKVLNERQAELRDGLAKISEQRTKFESEVATEIAVKIERDLALLKDAEQHQLEAELNKIASEYIRPLSHRLAQEVPEWQPIQSFESRLKWRDIAEQIRPELSLQPLLLTVIASLAALPSFSYFYGWNQALVIVLIAASLLYLGGHLMRALSGFVTKIKSSWIRALVITLQLWAISLPLSFVADRFANKPELANFVLANSLVVLPVFGWAFLLGGATNASLDRLEANLRLTVDRLDWVRARTNLISWFERGELAMLLHGPVQSAIYYGSHQFSENLSLSAKAKLLDEIADRIREALGAQADEVNLLQLAEELQEFWQGLCQVDFVMDDEISDALESDKIAQTVAWDVIKEACTNAIRHGKASSVTIALKLLGSDALGISVRNNGLAIDSGGEILAMDAPRGLGSKLLDSISISWSLTKTTSAGGANETVLAARLPIEPARGLALNA
jgi:signal transduction histidine kinase